MAPKLNKYKLTYVEAGKASEEVEAHLYTPQARWLVFERYVDPNTTIGRRDVVLRVREDDVSRVDLIP